MLTYTDELRSPIVKLCVQEAISALRTNVDKSVGITIHVLCGAAAGMIKTAGNRNRQDSEWADQECALLKKSVRRQLRKFMKTNNHEERGK